MRVFERYMNSAQYKWNWYMCTLVGSMIPVLMRFFISLDCGIAMFDIKDLLFAGLAMNLSNLSLLNSRKMKQNDRIGFLSGLFILFISAFLGLFFFQEDPTIKTELSKLKIVSSVLVVSSIWLSYRTINTIFASNKTSKK